MDIFTWLRELGLNQYENTFRENEIDAKILLRLTADDLKDMGVMLVGHRRKLLEAIAVLNETTTKRLDDPTVRTDAASSQISAEAERRQLTVLFCDLSESTKLSAKLDPEDLGDLIRAYQICCSDIVKRWGGHLAKYMGDGVLVYFGWPQAHEDDAERATRAGLELVTAVSQLATNEGEPLSARVGIATGLVMVGDLAGEGAAQEEAVVGETPNLAARLQGLAKPSQVIISATTRLLLGELFHLRELGARQLKGFNEPIPAWQALGAGSVEGRFDARHPRNLSSLFGREEELRLLASRWQLAANGEGRIVLLSGEPGIGKSHLLRSLTETIERKFWRLSYHCSAYYSNSPLHPVLRHLERAAGFGSADTSETKLDKLEILVAQATDRVMDTSALLATALRIPHNQRYPKSKFTPQEQKYKTFEVLMEQIKGLAYQRPVLMVLEDAHWIDPTTEELFGFLIEQIQHLPVLLVVTFRPHYRPIWGASALVTQLSLGRLARAQVKELITELTSDNDLPPDVFDEIIAKTDGVPLFVEELTKAVIEAGHGRTTTRRDQPPSPLMIPTTLNDSLLARLDHLSPVRSIAQIGSVLGREFSYELMAMMSSMNQSELGEALDQLCQAELLLVRGLRPASTYIFKHALVRDAAYSTLLRPRRQALHRQASAALERLFEGRLDEVLHLLTHHYSEAGDNGKAISYLIRFADQSIHTYALKEVEASLLQGLTLADQLEDKTERTKQRLSLKQRLSQCYYLLGRFEESAQTLLDEAELLNRGDDPETTAPCLFGLSHILLRLARYDEAAYAAETSIAQAELLGDSATAGKAYGALCCHGALIADAKAGHQAGLRSVKLLGELDETYWLGMTHFYQGLIDIALGRFDTTVAFGNECVRLGEECVDARLQTYGMFLAGWALANSGAHREGTSRCESAVQRAPDPSSQAYASAFLAYTHLESGDYDKALPSLTEAVHGMRLVGFRPFYGFFSAMLAEAERMAGRLPVAAAIADQALLETRDFRYPLGLGWVQRVQAKVVWDQRGEQAVPKLKCALETFTKSGAMFEASRTHSDIAQAYEGTGNLTEASKHLKQAAKLLAGLGITDEVELYRFGLDNT